VSKHPVAFGGLSDIFNGLARMSAQQTLEYEPPVMWAQVRQASH
jgi:hypothetical protein